MTEANTLPHDIYSADDWLMIRALPAARIAGLAQAAARQGGWDEIVPGLDSLSLSWNPSRSALADVHAHAASLLIQAHEPSVATQPETAVLHICYDAAWAPDAEIVSELLGMDMGDLPAWHSAQTWRVAMLGFQPGFAYLVCDTAIPDIPRLADPRSHVEAGSVGLLGRQCGLYPHAGPGGWPVIGRIAETLFDPLQPSPALLSPGQAVRFERLDRAAFDSLIGHHA
ncbi:allophanate hydrolase subunit 1 [Blastomonas sp.]|uniref:5-oxoprolinase subunit B family protein n=1 Tax=Blastomonas sp. TaxID=1909299 RepID=UPI00359301D7